MMSPRPCSSSASRKAGHQRQVAGGQRRHTEDVDVVFDGLARRLVRRLEQRPDIDIEAEIGEGRGDDLLAAVVAVLAHLGDQDARPSTVRGLEGLDQLHDAGHISVFLHLGFVYAGNRRNAGAMPAIHLLQSVGNLADGRLHAGRRHGALQEVSLARLGVLGERVKRLLDGCPRRVRRADAQASSSC